MSWNPEAEKQAKQARLQELARQDAEEQRLKSLLKPSMKYEEVAAIYPAYGVLMSWGAECLGRDFEDFFEFLEYFEGKKEYPKNSRVTRRFAT